MLCQWLPRTLCVSNYPSPLSPSLAHHSYRRTDRRKDHEDEAHKAKAVKSEEDLLYDVSSEAASTEAQVSTPMDVCSSEDDASSSLDYDGSGSCVSLLLLLLATVHSSLMSRFHRLSSNHPSSARRPPIRL